LNLGHTFAYAIELVSEQEIGHGEAVAIGLVAAANLSARQGYCDHVLQTRIEGALRAAALPTHIPGTIKPEQLLQAMNADKKKKGGRLRFVLLRDIGDVFVTGAVPPTAVLETMRELCSPTE